MYREPVWMEQSEPTGRVECGAVASVHCPRSVRITLGPDPGSLGSGLPDSLLCGCLLKRSQRCRQ